ncbi:MAG: DUF1972 domain-containing protein [Bacteroidetes bacterium]|nr:DUF1972 domain-containing protein [Bacteroidota bacterium]
MKVGILGTRGIPNYYGGFEQFAEFFSCRLAKRGIEVWVYNSHNHPYQKPEWNGVHIVHCFDPEYLIGAAGPFIYDLNCILDSRKRHFDVILQLGYASASVWHRFVPKGVKIVTNVDGLEWSRSKYNLLLKSFIRMAESLAVKSSDLLIADSPHIGDYFYTGYHANSKFIPYGAEILEKPDASCLKIFNLEPGSYHLAISRIQMDNNVEVIIKGYIESASQKPLLLVGSTNNKYCKYLQSNYPSPNIRFMGGIYDVNLLNQLRYHSSLYFHGHSSGGTNPSLLEAMASGALICAHENRFNRKILGPDAFYFSDEHQIADLIRSNPIKSDHSHFFSNNVNKIKAHYQWDRITDSYIEAFNEVLLK